MSGITDNTKVIQRGNSLAVYIPYRIVRLLNILPGEQMVIDSVGDALVLRREGEGKTYDLARVGEDAGVLMRSGYTRDDRLRLAVQMLNDVIDESGTDSEE